MFLKITFAAALILFFGYQAYAYMQRDTTPTQPYRVVRHFGELELRFYPPAVTATVHKHGEYRALMNDGFRDLAGYIFGGNDRQEKIAMTAPVIAVPDDRAAETARQLAREEAIFAGISSGAAAYAALLVANELGAGKDVVVILPDTGERYLSTDLFEL